MSKFSIGDHVVCVRRLEDSNNWYEVGDKHVVSSAPISAWCEDTKEPYKGYNTEAHIDEGVWIDERDFELVGYKKEVSKENKFAQVFNMWQDDFCNNPQAYELASDTAMRHLKEKLDGKEPSYGAVAAQIFQQYLTTLENQNV